MALGGKAKHKNPLPQYLDHDLLCCWYGLVQSLLLRFSAPLGDTGSGIERFQLVVILYLFPYIM